MASGIFAILDDIAMLMDDVATMGKVATKKTAGILGDDLSVNAEKATGFVSSRELPVLWAITKGSFINKIIILPIIFLLNTFFPFGTILLLTIGGIYLAYEGIEKIIAYFFHHSEKAENPTNPKENDTTNTEKAKIKAAITTDFILSIEIVIIALSAVLNEPFITQITVVAFVAFIATVGVYGIVALIVRMDDAGLYLINKSNNKGIFAFIGNGLIQLLPLIIRLLGIVGTIALLLVAGGIFNHQIPYFHHSLNSIYPMLKDFILGAGVGLVAVLVFTPISFLYKKITS